MVGGVVLGVVGLVVVVGGLVVVEVGVFVLDGEVEGCTVVVEARLHASEGWGIARPERILQEV